jgi:trans-2,3-dihydro-3-hydroxyanthranilate isomerase
VPDPGDVRADEMQALARGMSFAETAFVVPPTDPRAAFALRCFTPTTEVSYSGHQLLGAAYVLAAEGRLALDGPVTRVEAQIGGQVYPVALTASGGEVSRVSVVERPAEFLGSVDDFGALAAALSIGPMEILEAGLPAQVVRTGLSTLIVPVVRLATVRELMPVPQALDELLHDLGAVAALVFSRQTLSAANDVHVRVFATPLGIDEDPATGTANGALAAYLVRHGAVAAKPRLKLRSEQGTEMGRPSIIELEVDAATDPPVIHVGGRVAKSVEGSVFY